MADGYASIMFNTLGEGRVTEIHYLDFRLECIDLDCDYAYDLLESQLPESLKDVLIMVFFDYKCVTCGDCYNVEYEDDLILKNYVIMKVNYKEFSRQMITEELLEHEKGLHRVIFSEDEDEKIYYERIVKEWEEFYDEDFEPFVRKAVEINEPLFNLS